MAMGLEDGKTTEGDGLGDSKIARVERGLEEIRKSMGGIRERDKDKGRAVKKERVESVEEMEECESEEGEGVETLETWKMKKLRKERLEKEERKIRKEEDMVSRQKDVGRSREEVFSTLWGYAQRMEFPMAWKYGTFIWYD